MNTTLEQIASVRSFVLPNVFRDSVELMRVAADLEVLPGIQRAALVMATGANRDVVLAANLARAPLACFAAGLRGVGLRLGLAG
jgi:hypothetical protein